MIRFLYLRFFLKTKIPFEPDDKDQKTENNVYNYYKDNPILNLPNVEFGGTGFFYDKAPPLPEEIEHCMPDYHLYDEWISDCISNGAKESEFVYYTEYSIGYLTRGCFRQCEFCVNRNKKKCEKHSKVNEFMDDSRKKLCFLDDNFFANPNWKDIIECVKKTGNRFQFKQGLDERLLNKEKIEELYNWKYDGDYIFAFDNIEDKSLIEDKLTLMYSLHKKYKHRLKFYVFCGYDRDGIQDKNFYKKDINDLFDRCFTLIKYNALPYIMRHEKQYTSEYGGIYSNIAAWANQPSIFLKFTFREFCICRGMSGNNYSKYKKNYKQYLLDGGRKMSSWKCMESFENEFPDIAKKYFDIRPCDLIEYGK